MQFDSHEEFESWLETQSQEVCVAIGCRAALRVWPIILANSNWRYGDDSFEKQKSLVLRTGWGLVTTAAAVVGKDYPELRESAYEAAISNTSAEQHLTGRGDASLLHMARLQATRSVRHNCVTVGGTVFTAGIPVFSSTNAANFASIEMAGLVTLAQAQHDADFPPEDMLRQPLWHDTGPPEGLRPEDIGETILDTNPHFSFFKRWYDGMVAGKPLPTDLLTRIVTEIDRETWESGAETVATEIAQIEADWNAQKADNTNRAPEFEPNTVAHLFDYPRSRSASLALASNTIIQNFEVFQSQTTQWLNETPEFLKPLEAVPASLDRIAEILATQSRSAETEQALREEIGRLNARIADLEIKLSKATEDADVKSKPWFGSVKYVTGGLAAAMGAVIWIAQDDKGPAHKCENISAYWEYFGGTPWQCLEVDRPVSLPKTDLPPTWEV
ncbi:hypothetical protein [Cognatishimia sp. F0-27]|uniref:hypothetical protein n=1 Tax=Cognatishimia sp. F0-27 TaxID=2816855 RepID=UPI001D0C49C8|nr:hypothetical protein [Cognatishimia sp. F0-27]MCC1492188.1 hypothetical protein [Cognatishimia sp. F0-27]